jgi:hypothetical protein
MRGSPSLFLTRLGSIWNKVTQNIGTRKNIGMEGSGKWKTTGFQNIGMQDLGCLDCRK